MTNAAGSGQEHEAYELFKRGTELLERGDSAAAATVLARAVEQEPTSASLLEAYARAQFDSGRPHDAAKSFARLLELSPDADYARFGYGLCLSRLGRFSEAAEQLRMATVMRPDRREYAEHLRQVRATLAARRTSGTA
ncbi:MAG: tetratricopeptide repeat protein [Actinomycetes bacterium]